MISKFLKHIKHFFYITYLFFALKYPRELYFLHYFSFHIYTPKYFNNESEKRNINITDKNNTIPKKIFLCYKNKNIPSNIIENIQKLNKDWEITFFDDKECGNFINKNFDNEIYNIFCCIKDGPIRADLFRLCILYKYGGVYSDIDNILNYSLENFLEKNATFVVGGSYMKKDLLNPCFIASTQFNPILKQTIDLYRNIISKQKYSYWSYSIVYSLSFILKDHLVLDNKPCLIKLKECNQNIQILEEKCDITFNSVLSCYKNLNKDLFKYIFLWYNSKPLIQTHSEIYDGDSHMFFDEKKNI